MIKLDKSEASVRIGRLLGALAHPARARIVQELGRGRLCVNDMAEILKISHSAVSQHLAILRSQRLIQEQKEGRFVFYQLVEPELARWLSKAETFTDDGAQSSFSPPVVSESSMARD